MAALLLPLLLSSCGKPQAEGCADLIVSDAWIRSMPPRPSMTAGYLQIENHGAQPISLESFSSKAFSRIELHETRDVDGQMQMRAIKKLEIPSGDIVSMQPGGKHLMLFEPKQPLRPGEQRALVLSCAKGSLTIQADVRAISGTETSENHQNPRNHHGHH